MIDSSILYIPQGKTYEGFLSKLSIMKEAGKSNLFVIADFDKTFTVSTSFTSWSLLARSGIVGDNYANERDALHAIYRPIEVDNSLDWEYRKEKIREWWLGHLSLLLKYGISRDQIDYVVSNKNFMNLRPGSIDFIKALEKNNIPLIIVSAGLGNFIEEFLKLNGVLSSNISIEANFLTFDENGVVNGIDKNHIIHPFNKDNHTLKETSRLLVGNRKNAFVMGDNTEDIRIKNLVNIENYLSIGFLAGDTVPEYFDNTEFDCVSTQESFELVNACLKEIL